MFKRQTLIAGLIFTGVVFLIAMMVFNVTYKRALDQLSATGEVRIEQARDRLTGQLSGFRQLANFLTKHPRVVTMLESGTVDAVANEFLLNIALSVGADEIYVLDSDGTAIASSDYATQSSVIGSNFKTQGHVVSALDGSLGFFHSLGRNDQSRDFLFARSALHNDGETSGVVVVQVNIAALEFEWRIDEDVIAFFDENDVAFVTNRPSLAMRGVLPATTELKNKSYYDALSVLPIFEHTKRYVFGHDIWAFDEGEDLPPVALVVKRPIAQLELSARVFMDVSSARLFALIQSISVSAVLGLIGLIFLVLRQRRQNLSDRLAIEEAANARLEANVEERTQQLRLAQHQLIAAGKLTALGQMSAGISHELNQPLAAIQNFAENGEKFLELDRTSDAKNNFDLIKGQIDRMTRIIRSLRAFARKEKETIEPVDFGRVIRDSIQISKARCEAESVQLVVDKIPKDMMVLGGHIRLQQVIINLFTNAIDAMADTDEKAIHIYVTLSVDTISLTVRDNGPGLVEPDRVFEPFYTTKDIGASKGLGLGLSISHGIVGSFGGDIMCQNHAEGGAEFILTLRRAESVGEN
jgi:two-component system C4-dicarboxylate transport sensor histidine kinase DctB